MKFIQRFIKDEAGVLSFEWILIITVLVIGIVGGMTALRDATIIMFGGTAEAAACLDRSFGDKNDLPNSPYGWHVSRTPNDTLTPDYGKYYTNGSRRDP